MDEHENPLPSLIVIGLLHGGACSYELGRNFELMSMEKIRVEVSTRVRL